MELIKRRYDNNTYILVKLSVSLSDAIKQYTDAHSNTLPDPKIIFYGNRGAIRFPNGKNYDFSIEQSENASECLRQRGRYLEAIGKMACCLQVKGKDDVYQRTKTRMAAVEKERRKNCTKLLAANGNEEELLDDTSPESTPHQNTTATATLTTATTTTTTTTTTLTPTSIATTLPTTNNHVISNVTATHNLKRCLPASKPYDFPLKQPSENGGSKHSNKCDTNGKIDNNHDNQSNGTIGDLNSLKAEFDTVYDEYQKLHAYLQSVELRFKNLEHKFKQAPIGSKDYEILKRETFREYDRMNSDKKFHNARSKHKNLHARLTSIKENILQLRDKDKKRKRI